MIRGPEIRGDPCCEKYKQEKLGCLLVFTKLVSMKDIVFMRSYINLISIFEFFELFANTHDDSYFKLNLGISNKTI